MMAVGEGGVSVREGAGKRGPRRAGGGGEGRGVVVLVAPVSREIGEAQGIEGKEDMGRGGGGTLRGGGGVRAAERGGGVGRPEGEAGGGAGGAGEAHGSRRGGGPSAGLLRDMFATDVART